MKTEMTRAEMSIELWGWRVVAAVAAVLLALAAWGG